MRAALVLILFFAGCAVPEERSGPSSPSPTIGASAPSPEECDTLAARGPSGNAPPLPLFEEDASHVAARLAEALGDPLVSREPREPTGGFTGHRFPDVALEWETEQGYIELLDGESRAWRYWGARHWAPLDAEAAEGALLAMLRDLDLPLESFAEPEMRLSDEPAQRRVDGSIAQARAPGLLLRDAPSVTLWVVEDRTGMGDRSQLTLPVLRELRDASVALSPQDAGRLATLASLCHLREDAQALATFQAAPPAWDAPHVVGDTLALTTAASYHDGGDPCGGSRVLAVSVDAVTGAVLRVGPPSVGCIR